MKLTINVTGINKKSCGECRYYLGLGPSDDHGDCDLFHDKQGYYGKVDLDENRTPLRMKQCLAAEKKAKETK